MGNGYTNKQTNILQKDLDKMLIHIPIEVSADATGGVSETVFANMRIVDVVVNCTTANAGGTLTVSDGTNDITDAIACAVLDVVDRAGTIDSTYATVSAGSSLTVTANGALDRGVVTVVGVRV